MARLIRLALRVTAALAAVLLLTFAALVVLVVLKRDGLMRRGLRIAAAKTGAAITARSLDLGVATSGLEVVANDVAVAYGGQSARAKRVKAVFGYGQLMRLRLLPLKSLSLAQPEVAIAPVGGSGNQSFDLKSYVAMLPKLASTAAGLASRATIVNGKLSLDGLKAAGKPAPGVELDVSLKATSLALSVAIQRISWNGPPIDGFSASAAFTIPSEEAQQTKSAHGTVEFIRRSNIGLNGELRLTVSQEAALNGEIRVNAAQVPRFGQVGFNGSYSLSADEFRLAGDVLMPAGVGLSGRFAAELAIAEQFSANPKANLTAGPFQVQVEQATKAFGTAQTSALRGELDVQRVEFATELKPWRQALAQCSDAACRQREMLGALVGASSGALVIASGALFADDALVPASLRERGLLSLELQSPARLMLDHGAAMADNLAVRIGPLAITRGQLRVDAKPAMGAGGVRAAYKGGFFVTSDLSRLELHSMLPASARSLLRSKGVAYAQANFGGMLADDNGRFGVQTPWVELSRGFVEFDSQGHNALVFGGRAELERKTLVSSAHVTVLGGGTLTTDGRFALPSRTLRARISLSRVDVWRWYRALVQDSSLSRVKMSGRARGQLSVLWVASDGAPRVKGALTVTALSIDSVYTKKPVLVRSTRFGFNDRGGTMSASAIMLGGSNFNLQAAVADFAKRSINLTIFGNRFDVDAINFAGAGEASRAQAKARANPTGAARRSTIVSSSDPARLAADSPSTARASADAGTAAATAPPLSPLLALAGAVNLRSVFFNGVRMDDLTADFNGEGSQWEVRNFSGKTLRGLVNLGARWDGVHQQLYLTGAASRIDARALFVALGSKDRQPVSGELSLRINVGAFLPGAGAPPVLSCGGATIVVANGALGKADVLVRIMELLNVEGWLTFHPPDLDKTGLPFNRILARITFMPEALAVQQLQLSGPVIRLVGHGQMSMPDERLDLHLLVMPFTSPRWALVAIPVVGSKLGHTFDAIFSVRITVSGPASSADVSPELFGSVVDALVGIIELPLDFMPENIMPEALLPPNTRDVGVFKKCEPPP